MIIILSYKLIWPGKVGLNAFKAIGICKKSSNSLVLAKLLFEKLFLSQLFDSFKKSLFSVNILQINSIKTLFWNIY